MGLKKEDFPQVPLLAKEGFSLNVRRCKRVGHQVQEIRVKDVEND